MLIKLDVLALVGSHMIQMHALCKVLYIRSTWEYVHSSSKYLKLKSLLLFMLMAGNKPALNGYLLLGFE